MPSEKIFIEADTGHLYIAFHNIIKNAVQAMSDKGTLSLRVNKDNKGQINISFTDTGIGIASENIDKVFQPLFTTKIKGFGFGLAICKMIFEKHRGTITIKSELGNKTVVMITLPLEK